jgi:acetylornithine/succinyldiaminopimelate/putrescine aminotransferase
VNQTEAIEAIDEDTAAVILEPIQSIGGVRVFENKFLAALRKACDKAGAKLIFDEVQTGVGRTGAPFVSGSCGVIPDIMTLAKSLAAGFPIGAVVMKERTAAGIEAGQLGSTFGGGPLAMAALIATLAEIKKKDLMGNAQTFEHYVREKFVMSEIADVRGRGCLMAITLDREAKPVQQALFEKGIIVGLCSDKYALHLLPPLTIAKTHVDVLHSALEEVLA